MRLSVCIPVYGVERYVERCARSLFAQTLKDGVEFVFVDDCTKDGSMDVIRRVLAEFPVRQPQVKLLRHDRNRGLMAARRTALAAATGAWTVHCDSDDWVDPDLYEKMLARGEATGADMVYCPVVRNESEPFTAERASSFEGTGAEFLSRIGGIASFNSAFNKMYRRGVSTSPEIEFPEAVSLGEDLCFTAQAVARCAKVTSVGGSFYHYRVNEESLSRKFDADKALKDLVGVYETVCRRVPGPVSAVVRKSLLRDLLYFALRFGAVGREDFRRLSADLSALSDVPWPADTSAFRRTAVEVGRRCRPLGRLLLGLIGRRGFRGF